jgi:hypothetical protein
MRVSNLGRRQLAQYALDTLHALPCGCVASVHRTRPWEVQVVTVEAQGPHCVHRHHSAGAVLGVGQSEPEHQGR